MLQPYRIRPSLGTILPKLDQSESFSSKFGTENNRNQGDCPHVAGDVTFVLQEPVNLSSAGLPRARQGNLQRQREMMEIHKEKQKQKIGSKHSMNFWHHPGFRVNLSSELAAFLTLISMQGNNIIWFVQFSYNSTPLHCLHGKVHRHPISMEP